MPLFSGIGGIWVFNAEQSRFPGGIFRTREAAESWIAQHKLSGVLTLYPLDTGVYDLFVSQQWFKPKKPDHYSPKFIGGFTDAGQDRYHYENGCGGDILPEESS